MSSRSSTSKSTTWLRSAAVSHVFFPPIMQATVKLRFLFLLLVPARRAGMWGCKADSHPAARRDWEGHVRSYFNRSTLPAHRMEQGVQGQTSTFHISVLCLLWFSHFSYITGCKAKGADLEQSKCPQHWTRKDVQRVRQRDKLMKKVFLIVWLIDVMDGNFARHFHNTVLVDCTLVWANGKEAAMAQIRHEEADFVKVQDEEKSFKKKMEEAAKIWQDSKCVSQSKGFSSRVARSQSPDLFYSWLGL